MQRAKRGGRSGHAAKKQVKRLTAAGVTSKQKQEKKKRKGYLGGAMGRGIRFRSTP